MKIEKIKNVDTIERIKQLKAECRVNHEQFDHIKAQVSSLNMSQKEYKALMQARPLIKYRPARNSFVKRGDKALLAQGLNVETVDVDNYIDAMERYNFETGKLINLSSGLTKNITDEDIKLAQPYVYRHGTKEQVLAWFNLELNKAHDVLATLYKSMDDNLEGVSSYYNRPCHALDDYHAKKMYSIIEKNLDIAQSEGRISKADKFQAAEWSLKRIYKIQNNPDLRQVFKFVWKNNIDNAR